MGAAAAGILAFALLLQKKEAEPRVTVQGPEPSVVRLGDVAIAKVVFDGPAQGAQLEAPKSASDLEIVVGAASQLTERRFDGRTSTTTIRTSWQLSLRPRKEGAFEIAPIAVTAAGETHKTKALRLECVRDLAGAKVAFLEVKFSKAKYFAQEPVRVTVRFGIDKAMYVNMVQLFSRPLDVAAQVEAPWLADFPGGVPIESGAPPRPDDRRAQFALNQIVAEATPLGEVDRASRPYLVFEFDRAWLPGKLGTLELAAPLLRFRYATRFRNDFFGNRTVDEYQNAFVYGEPTSIEILPIPEEGRPASFTGAVGKFTVSADASPREVKVGEIVRYKLRIEGSGNLEFLEPPKLESLDGFHVFGKLDDKGRTERVVTYELSPLHAAVKEIPAVPFTYFDIEGQGSFRTVRTAAIPLHVKPLPPGEALTPFPEDPSKRVTMGVDDIFDIEPAASAESGETAPGFLAFAAAFGAPWLAAAAGFVALRRRERDRADPSRPRARGAAAKYARARGSGADAAAAFTTYLADRLGCLEAAVLADDLGERLAAAGIEGALAERAASRLLSEVGARYSGAKARAESASAADFDALAAELERAFARPRGNR